MRYNVTINETLARTLQVEADLQRNAELTISRLYYNNDIVLSADDYLSTEIIVDEISLTINPPPTTSPSSRVIVTKRYRSSRLASIWFLPIRRIFSLPEASAVRVAKSFALIKVIGTRRRRHRRWMRLTYGG